MDNEYTRREKICPLSQTDAYCDREDKNCNICIAEEEQYQIEQAMKETSIDV